MAGSGIAMQQNIRMLCSTGTPLVIIITDNNNPSVDTYFCASIALNTHNLDFQEVLRYVPMRTGTTVGVQVVFGALRYAPTRIVL